MLKETLSREIDEPGPGPFSVLNCSQNLQRDTSVLTGSRAEGDPITAALLMKEKNTLDISLK